VQDEETLVKSVQEGDLASFEKLIDRHASHLRAFVAMKLPVPHLIDEIAHEAFVFAHRHIHDFKAGTDFGKWLRAIAFNLVRKETLRHQRASKNQEKFLDYCLIETAGQDRLAPDTAVAAYLEECVAELSESQRVLLERKYSLSESSEEIAKALAKSEAWVRTTLCRIRTALRACIEEKMAQTPAR